MPGWPRAGAASTKVTSRRAGPPPAPTIHSVGWGRRRTSWRSPRLDAQVRASPMTRCLTRCESSGATVAAKAAPVRIGRAGMSRARKVRQRTGQQRRRSTRPTRSATPQERGRSLIPPQAWMTGSSTMSWEWELSAPAPTSSGAPRVAQHSPLLRCTDVSTRLACLEDADSDGHVDLGDCDPGDPSVHPLWISDEEAPCGSSTTDHNCDGWTCPF